MGLLEWAELCRLGAEAPEVGRLGRRRRWRVERPVVTRVPAPRLIEPGRVPALLPPVALVTGGRGTRVGVRRVRPAAAVRPRWVWRPYLPRGLTRRVGWHGDEGGRRIYLTGAESLEKVRTSFGGRSPSNP